MQPLPAHVWHGLDANCIFERCEVTFGDPYNPCAVFVDQADLNRALTPIVQPLDIAADHLSDQMKFMIGMSSEVQRLGLVRKSQVEDLLRKHWPFPEQARETVANMASFLRPFAARKGRAGAGVKGVDPS